jgi:MioC protein
MPDPSTAVKDILLLIGTQTGNAEMVAEDMAEVLSDEGFRVHLVDMADSYAELLGEYQQVILCTSTWGDGELPDNAIDLYESIETLEPALGHILYGIMALGDHVYDPHFCAAARIFERLFDRLGATRVIDTHQIDAGPDQRDLQDAKIWALHFAGHLKTSCAQGASAA